MNKELFVVAMLGFMLVMGGVFACEEYKPPTPVDDGCDQDQQQDQEQSQETNIDNKNTNTNNNDNDNNNDNKNTNTQGQSQTSDNKNTNTANVVNSGNSVNTNVNTVVVDLDQFVSQMNKMNQKSAQVNYQAQGQVAYAEANPVAEAGIIMVNGMPYCKTSDGKLCPCYVDGNGTLVVDAQTNTTAVPMEETGGGLGLLFGGVTAALGGLGVAGAAKAGWLTRFGM